MDIRFTQGRWVEYETHKYDVSHRKMVYLGTYIDNDKKQITVEEFAKDFEVLVNFDSDYDIITYDDKERKNRFFSMVVDYINSAKKCNL